MNRWVIHKRSRAPRDESYSGITWDKASLRHRYKKQYTDLNEAIDLAEQLSKFNPVGFVATRIKEGAP
jgi:hypothetical protein